MIFVDLVKKYQWHNVVYDADGKAECINCDMIVVSITKTQKPHIELEYNKWSSQRQNVIAQLMKSQLFIVYSNWIPKIPKWHSKNQVLLLCYMIHFEDTAKNVLKKTLSIRPIPCVWFALFAVLFSKRTAVVKSCGAHHLIRSSARSTVVS